MKNLGQISSAVFASTALLCGLPAAAQGYLTSDQTSNVVRVVLPAPVAGDARSQADQAIFRSARSLEGSARWTLAQSDDDVSTSGLLRAFRCAGVTLTPDSAPELTKLITRAKLRRGSGRRHTQGTV